MFTLISRLRCFKKAKMDSAAKGHAIRKLSTPQTRFLAATYEMGNFFPSIVASRLLRAAPRASDFVDGIPIALVADAK